VVADPPRWALARQPTVSGRAQTDRKAARWVSTCARTAAYHQANCRLRSLIWLSNQPTKTSTSDNLLARLSFSFQSFSRSVARACCAR